MKRLLAALLLPCLLVGCSQSAPYNRARHYVTHDAMQVSGNFKTDVNGTIKLMLPTFETAYQNGQKSRMDGASRADAENMANEIRRQYSAGYMAQELFSNNKSIGGSEPSQMDAREARALGDAVAGAFLDGYEGKK